MLSHKPVCSGARQLEIHKHQTLASDPCDNTIILVLRKYKAVGRVTFLQNLQMEQISCKQIKCGKASGGERVGRRDVFSQFGFIHNFRDTTNPLVPKKCPTS